MFFYSRPVLLSTDTHARSHGAGRSYFRNEDMGQWLGQQSHKEVPKQCSVLGIEVLQVTSCGTAPYMHQTHYGVVVLWMGFVLISL